jgi:hypothetical protein
MQNRRLVTEDGRGVADVKQQDEKDKDGFGLSITARYYMHIFDRTNTLSHQRRQQLYINQPL